MHWRVLFPSRGALAIAAFVCVVAPAVLVWIHVVDNPRFSPIDEAAHFDYVDRIADGELPRQGERLRQSTLRELACRKTAVIELPSPPCETRRLRYDQFSATYQHEAQQPPTYYAITVPLRWLAENVARVDDKLRATRVTNIVWLIAGLLLLWAAGRVMGVDPLALGAGVLLLVIGPNVIYQAAIVTNDATAITAGGLVAFVGALAYRRDGPRVPLALMAAGFLAAAMKVSNLFAVATVAAAFAVPAVAARSARDWLRTGGALLGGGLAAGALWSIVHRSRALIDLQDDPTFATLRHTPRTLELVLREATELLQPLGRASLSDTLSHFVQVPVYWIVSFLLIGAGLAGLFVSRRRWQHVLGLVAVPLLYVGGVVFGLGLMLTYDIDPGLTGRYGLSMAPLLALVLAASLEGRWARYAVAAFAAAAFFTTLVAMA